MTRWPPPSPGYDGLAIRSTTKVTAKTARKSPNGLKVIGRAGSGVDNIDVPAATAQRHRRDEHTVRQLDYDRRTLDRDDLRAGTPHPDGRRRRPRAKRKWEKGKYLRRRAEQANALASSAAATVGSIVADRALGLQDARHRLRSVPLGGSGRSRSASRKVELDAILERADIITLHAPLTPQTRNVLSAEALAQARSRASASSIARAAALSTRRR